jgi:hypothetical protein
MIIITVTDTTSAENIGITVSFTKLFAMSFALFTQATNQEALGAAAAYTAALVIFRGSIDWR